MFPAVELHSVCDFFTKLFGRHVRLLPPVRWDDALVSLGGFVYDMQYVVEIRKG